MSVIVPPAVIVLRHFNAVLFDAVVSIYGVEQANLLIDSSSTVFINGLWEDVPQELPEGVNAFYPCAVPRLMTPFDDLYSMNDDPNPPVCSTQRWLLEARSDVNFEQSSLINEYMMLSLNETEGEYEGGQIEQCLSVHESDRLADNRRGGKTIYRTGYFYDLLIHRAE
jgi:hypothetical protein